MFGLKPRLHSISPHSMAAKLFARRVSLFFLFLFLGMGIQLPFLPLWLKDKGLSAPQIAFILAAQIAIRVVAAPAGTFVADRTGNRRAMMQWCAFAMFASYLLLCFAGSFWSILVAALMAGAFFSVIAPLAESFAVDGAQTHHLDYGRLRLWGTISFITGNIAGGTWLEIIAVANVVYMITLAQFMLFGVTFLLPPDPATGTRPQGGSALRISDALRLFSSPAFPVFLAAVSLGQASHAVYYSFGSVYWKSLGYSEGIIGLLWLTGGMAEVLIFAGAGKAVRAAGPVLVMVTGIAGGALRWLVTSLDPVLGVLFAVQALHAFSFTLTHLGTMYYIQRSVPASLRNTAQGIYAALSGGLLMSLVTVLSGELYRDFGGGAYLAMAAISAAAGGFALALRLLNPKAQALGETS